MPKVPVIIKKIESHFTRRTSCVRPSCCRDRTPPNSGRGQGHLEKRLERRRRSHSGIQPSSKASRSFLSLWSETPIGLRWPTIERFSFSFPLQFFELSFYRPEFRNYFAPWASNPGYSLAMPESTSARTDYPKHPAVDIEALLGCYHCFFSASLRRMNIIDSPRTSSIL